MRRQFKAISVHSIAILSYAGSADYFSLYTLALSARHALLLLRAASFERVQPTAQHLPVSDPCAPRGHPASRFPQRAFDPYPRTKTIRFSRIVAKPESRSLSDAWIVGTHANFASLENRRILRPSCARANKRWTISDL